MVVSRNCHIRIAISVWPCPCPYRCFVGYGTGRSSRSSEFRGRRELFVIMLKSPPHLRFFSSSASESNQRIPESLIIMSLNPMLC